MFGKKKKAPAPAFDVTQKLKKTWYGGKKRIPTTKAEQRKMKEAILKVYPEAIVIDEYAKQAKGTGWIDRIKEYDALFND